MNAPVCSFKQCGVSLIELMIGLLIGLIIVGVTFSVYLNSKLTMNEVTVIADMQESAMYAVRSLTVDVEHAGYAGLAPVRGAVDGRAGTTAAAGLPGISYDCGPGWAINVLQPLQVINNYTAEFSGTGLCFDSSVNSGERVPVQGTDVLLVQKADIRQATTLQNGIIYLRSNFSGGALFEPSAPPADISAPFQDQLWLPVVYFVRDYFLEPGDDIPSLWKLELGTDPDTGVYGLIEKEVAPGIENMQVQLGIDDDQDGSVNRYLDADHPAAAGAKASAVRIWLLLRTTEPDYQYTNANTYTLAGRTIDPANPDDNYKRQVMMITVPIRN